MAGQSVGMVTKEEPLADIVATLIGEASAALEQRAA
jgi:enoyl-[acyl-carrier protein] reductase II